MGAFTPQLVKATGERGVADLINTSSIAAQGVFPNFAVYSATKAYVTHLSRHLRVELGPKNVRVSAIEPGIVGTELQNHVTDDGALAWLESSKETAEWLTPQDIAQTIGFIASLPPRANLQQVTIMPTAQPSRPPPGAAGDPGQLSRIWSATMTTMGRSGGEYVLGQQPLRAQIPPEVRGHGSPELRRRVGDFPR
ncbi:SDR family oxidoreductase [Streptomyces sp. FXJ1.4098]|nr:SDR family oxidoreductase [Streptomyces sp. FXJ1.4098]